VALLTDLHLGPYVRAGRLRAWVAAANRAEPDLTLVGGDFVDRWYRGPLTELSDALAELRAPLGVWGVPGNHDYRVYPDLAPLRAALDAGGVGLLVNEGARVRDDAYLAGVDDDKEGRPDAGRALAGWDGGGARLVLTHNPDVFPSLRGAADLALAGHTHGGQVCVPGFGAVLTSSRYGRRFVAGWVLDDPPSFVSRGLGFSLLPLRVACPPELAVLELRPA
jgi:predicted MPP superfamily phosphohydrolase